MAPSRMPRAVKSAPDIPAVSASLHPPFVHSVIQRFSRTVSGRGTIVHRHEVGSPTNPRGPRSCPSYAVPVRPRLTGPIRPTRRHIATSPSDGLYAMPSLCGSAEATRERFRAFAHHSFLACHPLRPRGVRSSSVPEQRCRRGLRRILNGSALPKLPQSVSRGLDISRLQWFAHCYGLSACSPP